MKRSPLSRRGVRLAHRGRCLVQVEQLECRVVPAQTPLGRFASFGALVLDTRSYAPARVLVRAQPDADGPGCAGAGLGRTQSLVPGLCQLMLPPGVSVPAAL